jgi:hypothetical protein
MHCLISPDVSVSMDGDEVEEWLHRGSLTQEIEQPSKFELMQ